MLIPVTPCPVQVTVKVHLCSVDWQISCLCGIRVAVDVRLAVCAACVECGYAALSLAVGKLSSSKHMLLAKLHTLVVQNTAKSTVIVTGKSHLEAQAIRYLICLEHCILATLINGNTGLVEPAFLDQVSLECCQEVCPQILVVCR